MAQYLKPDCELGYIEEPAEIEKLKINNARHTILGCMLGDFDETGAYVVDPEIVKELIEMPKFIVETMDNIEICKSVLKLDKQISFAVTFEGNKATFSLLEKFLAKSLPVPIGNSPSDTPSRFSKDMMPRAVSPNVPSPPHA